MYLHEKENWTQFTIDYERICPSVASVRHHQGRVLAQFLTAGVITSNKACLEAFVEEVSKSAEIEGEKFDPGHVRSSLCRRLGVDFPDDGRSVPRNVDGAVSVTLDAVMNADGELTEDRLFGWHAALFPTGYSGLYKIATGRYRDGEMQVVSGGFGYEKVHYRAPSPTLVSGLMRDFLAWYNAADGMDLYVKAAVAHVWFVMIHPFDDGNGRLSRAISDMLIARSDGQGAKFYSVSNAIMQERKRYYSLLESLGHSDGDITEWIEWFVGRIDAGLTSAESALEATLRKSRFWDVRADEYFNERQRKMLNLLFDDFAGKLTSGKWAKICKVSSDTALNDLNDLVGRGILKRSASGGRSTNYELKL